MMSFLAITVALGQQTITGSVSDEDGAPLPGASIVEVGTNNGVVADFDGNFSISVGDDASLSVSFLGYLTQVVAVGNNTSIDVVLSEGGQLDEVVVTGFGSESRRLLTDNIASLDSEDISEIPTPNVFNTFAGKVAGVQVTQTNGKVESGFNFRIRGQASISASSQPLYVLDGIPLITYNESSNGAPTNPLITLSPNEIESIDILKDASAASIYGSQGANGVVIITTKKGRAGKAKFNLNVSRGVSNPSAYRDWMNASEYVEIFLEAGRNTYNAGLDFTGFVEGRLDRYSNGTWQQGTYDTDWEKIALVEGSVQDADFSVSGGSDNTNYFFSVAYNETEGIVLGNSLDKISARANISTAVTDKLTLNFNLGYGRTDIDRIANDNAFVTPLQAIAQAPISPAFVDGEPFTNTVYANFLLEDKYANYNTIIRRNTGKVSADLDLFSGLTFTSEFAYDLYGQSEDQFRGSLTPFMSTNGSGYASNATTENYIVTNYLNYEYVNDYSTLDVTVGSSLNKSKRRFSSVSGEQFPSDDFQTIASAAEITAGSGSFTSFSFVGYFARATYNIQDKYLFKAGIRRDGSSRFGENVQFGNFPSFSAGWILSNEDFIGDNIFSFLKLRGSWGEVGNAAIGNFAALGLFGATSFNQRPGLQPTQPSNQDLSWETTTQTDVSVQFGLLNDKITGELTYYNKDTDDLLFGEPIPGSSGFTSLTKNIGAVKNTGVEFLLNTVNIKNNDFTWSSSLNLATNENEVVTLPNGEDAISGRLILREGEPINAFYLVEYAGVNPDNGNALFYDADGVATESYSADYRKVVGNPFPDFIGGFTNYISYKNFELSFTFSAEFGASIYNSGGIYQQTAGDWFDNQTRDQLRRWRQPGDITDVPAAAIAGGNGTQHSTRYLQDGDFIRLKDLNLSYTVPQDMISSVGLEKARIYLSGINLLTITDYDGYDPESRGDSFNDGQTFYSAPAPRTVSLGVNLTF
jgi:TonB-linked SusC/RagA family outer membrane protein